MKGDGRYLERDVQVLGRTRPDSVVLVVYSELGPVDLYLVRRDSTELRGTYGPTRAPISPRRSRS